MDATPLKLFFTMTTYLGILAVFLAIFTFLSILLPVIVIDKLGKNAGVDDITIGEWKWKAFWMGFFYLDG